MAREVILGLVEVLIQGNGKMANVQGKVHTPGQMETATRVFLLTVSAQGRVF